MDTFLLFTMKIQMDGTLHSVLFHFAMFGGHRVIGIVLVLR